MKLQKAPRWRSPRRLSRQSGVPLRKVLRLKKAQEKPPARVSSRKPARLSSWTLHGVRVTREQAINYALNRFSQKIKMGQIAVELGANNQTISRWIEKFWHGPFLYDMRLVSPRERNSGFRKYHPSDLALDSYSEIDADEVQRLYRIGYASKPILALQFRVPLTHIEKLTREIQVNPLA